MQQGPAKRVRVMLADDYPGMHPALARLLTPWCEMVGNVLESAQILDEAMRLQPEVIILDVRMAGTNGLDTCRKLRAAVPASRVVLFSGVDDDAIRQSALDAGASGFVSKYRVADELLPAIRRAVAERDA